MSVRHRGMNTISEQKDFTLLSWDTDLFGFPVGRLHTACVANDSLDSAIAEMKENGVQLAYAHTPWADASGRERLEQAGATLVDRRVVLEKVLLPSAQAAVGVELWPATESSPELDALALASGHRSRFRLDPKIPDGVYHKLYLAWMHRSIRREIAAAVFVVREAGQVAGMATLSEDRQPASFGLMAVAPEFRRRGLAQRLLVAAETFSAARGETRIKLVAQRENHASCAFFSRNGFVETEEHAVYHIWFR